MIASFFSLALAQQRPDVVLIVADDLGWADTALNDPGGVPVPRIDDLAAQGVRFTRAYAAAPICGPSRAGLDTGQYPERYGFDLNVGGSTDPSVGLPLSAVTLAEVLGQAGYATALIGKWHLGNTLDQYPTNQGFDQFYGLVGGQTPYIDSSAQGVHFVRLGGRLDQTRRSGTSQIVTGQPPVVVHDFQRYLTDDLAARAAAYVRAHADTGPFFLEVAFTAPHTPFEVTDPYYARFPEVTDERRRVYDAMISALDDGVGTILDALAEAGLAPNTLVLFTSDNGCATYTGVCSCDPVRGGKGSHLEGGVRVPLVARWPATLPAGATEDRVVSLLDVLPTVASAAAAPPPPTDGVDLLPFLVGGDPGTPHEDLFWRTGSQHGARLGDLKLWDLATREPELFDLPTDPLELEDVGARRPDDLSQALAAYDAWDQQMPPPGWTTNPVTVDQCGDTVTVP